MSGLLQRKNQAALGNPDPAKAKGTANEIDPAFDTAFAMFIGRIKNYIHEHTPDLNPWPA